MRLHIEGKYTGLAPHLLERIAERLKALNTPDDDMSEAWVTLVQHKRQEVARVQLQVAGKPLHVTQRAATPDAAIDAALQMAQRALHEVRATRRLRATMPMATRAPVPTYAASAARPA